MKVFSLVLEFVGMDVGKEVFLYIIHSIEKLISSKCVDKGGVSGHVQAEFQFNTLEKAKAAWKKLNKKDVKLILGISDYFMEEEDVDD